MLLIIQTLVIVIKISNKNVKLNIELIMSD